MPVGGVQVAGALPSGTPLDGDEDSLSSSHAKWE